MTINHDRFEVEGTTWDLAYDGGGGGLQAQIISRPSTSNTAATPTARKEKEGTAIEPLLPPAPPPFPARLVVAHLSVPLHGKPSGKNNAYDPGQFDTLVEESLDGGHPTSPTLTSSASTRDFRRDGSVNGSGQKRRALVSLNSFSSMPTTLGGLSLSGDASRPKTSIKTSSNNFLTRVENAPSSTANAIKSLVGSATASAQPNASHGAVTLVFYTQHKNLIWAEVDALPTPTTAAGATKVSFTSNPTALAYNEETSSHTAIDLLVGFSSGDIIWVDPICGKFNRLNKAGCVTTSPVTALQWYPQQLSQSQSTLGMFLSAHADGTLILWSLDKDDPSPNATIFPPKDGLTDSSELFIERQPIPASEKKALGRVNPVTTMRISPKGLTDLALSPDKQCLAIASDDGRLRLINLSELRLMDTYCSYFGAFTCVSWSPDGRFLLAGGQDDLVSIWSPADQRLVARCQGHASFVTAIAFDEYETLSKDEARASRRAPRFASVGEDCRVVFWDLAGSALLRPKVTPNLPHQRRVSITSTISVNTLSRKRTIESQQHLPIEYGPPVLHLAPNRTEISILQPAVAAPVSSEILSGFQWLPHGFAALTRSGMLRIFSRP